MESKTILRAEKVRSELTRFLTDGTTSLYADTSLFTESTIDKPLFNLVVAQGKRLSPVTPLKPIRINVNTKSSRQTNKQKSATTNLIAPTSLRPSASLSKVDLKKINLSEMREPENVVTNGHKLNNKVQHIRQSTTGITK